jgi:hypothetical protein
VIKPAILEAILQTFGSSVEILLRGDRARMVLRTTLPFGFGTESFATGPQRGGITATPWNLCACKEVS